MSGSLRHAVVAISAGIFIAGCSADVQTPMGPLVPADPAQFSAPISVGLQLGSATGETSGGAVHYWLTQPSTTLIVSNNAQKSPLIELTATLTPPPCPGQSAQATIDSVNLPSRREQIPVGGKIVHLRLSLARGGQRVVQISILTPPCHITTDPRTFYAGLSGLSVATTPAADLNLGNGITGNQVAPPAPSLNWVTGATADLSLVNNADSSSKLTLAGFVIPPPCPGAAFDVDIGVSGSSSTRHYTGTAATPISLPLTLSAGATMPLRINVHSPSCRILTDTRTFYVGFVRLKVSPT
jgi:hypothetical protein